VLARALDRWWRTLGEPDPFVVVEAGAGTGALAAAILAQRAAFSSALRYVAVERSAPLRETIAATLPVELPMHVLGPVPPPLDEDEERQPAPGTGPLVTALAELPAGPVHVVVANELLDNLPFRLLERGAERWLEVRVGECDGVLSEVLVPAAPELEAEAARLAPDAHPGARIPIQDGARAWLRAALQAVERGRVVVVDYTDTTAGLARRPWQEWVRTYRAQARGLHPLERPGEQDVTCEVAVDQLARVAPPSGQRSQAEFLAGHGIHDLVDEARQQWQAAAAAPGLEALKARGRVTESAALLDPAGLGGFTVLEWLT
jgi:SAM-dependent MidA family methyltransferase